MPELPEVETTLRGIKPNFVQQKITRIIIRNPKLRWPIPIEIAKKVKGQTLQNITRRGKYLLFELANGTLILHLGMSGSLRIIKKGITPAKHDHVDIEFESGKVLRFTDPRRFGALLWTIQDPTQHSLLINLGVEPLSKFFNGKYLWEKTRNKKVAIKNLIMNSHIVVGVGNIYAAESLFVAGIHPEKKSGQLSKEECNKLTSAIKKILKKAITKGGTTLRNFSHTDGRPGYFSVHLLVYGRTGKHCYRCKTTLQTQRLGQRTTVFCPHCQAANK